jgi:hemolysin activation/secretion protein
MTGSLLFRHSRVPTIATAVMLLVAGSGAIFSIIAPARAQQPEAAAPALRFDIQRYQVDGNTLLKPADIARIVAPYTGKQKDFSDIQRALEVLEIAYRDLGYGTVQVLLPEQNIASGVVMLNVIEPRLGRIAVDGAKRNDPANIRRSMPGLREGEIPNSKEIARNLLLANENPARQLTVLMRAGESDDKVDATIKVTEDKAWKASVSFDNTGNTATGDYRVSAGFQHSNVFNRDHVATFQYITSPNHLADVQVYGFGYRIPLYSLGSSIEIVGGYSNVNSGNLAGLFSVAGSGTIGGLRFNHYLPKLGDYEQKLVYGVDYKAFQNNVIASGVSIVPDITVHPGSVTYYGTLRGDGSETGFYVNYTQNFFPGGNDGADTDFKLSRTDAKAGYRVYRYGANYNRAFANDWQTRFNMTGQYTDDALVAGEQFGIGGAENLRGFLEREVANDRGYRANAELYTPSLGPKFGWTNSDAQMRMLGFFDWGNVARNSALPSESHQQTLASTGVGLRFTATPHFSMRTDYARVIDAGGSQNKGHTRVHFSLSMIF